MLIKILCIKITEYHAQLKMQENEYQSNQKKINKKNL